MQECFQKYPEVYSKYSDDDEEDQEEGSSSEVKTEGNPSEDELKESSSGQTESQDKSTVTA